MKCIFKEEGYVPKEHMCISGCQPLEQIYSHAGLDKKSAKKASKNVLRAYHIINIDDKLRDEKLTKYQKFALKAGKALLKLPLKDEIVSYLDFLDRGVKNLEAKNTSKDEYLGTIGSAGKDIFLYSIPNGKEIDKEFIKNAGNIIAKGTTLSDMISDLDIDIETNSYNPLKNEKVHEYFGETMQKFRIMAKKVKINPKENHSFKAKTHKKITQAAMGSFPSLTNCAGAVDNGSCDNGSCYGMTLLAMTIIGTIIGIYYCSKPEVCN